MSLGQKWPCPRDHIFYIRSRGGEFDFARSHTFVEIDHEMVSLAILFLPMIHSRRVAVRPLQVKVCAQSTNLLLAQACPGKKSMVR